MLNAETESLLNSRCAESLVIKKVMVLPGQISAVSRPIFAIFLKLLPLGVIITRLEITLGFVDVQAIRHSKTLIGQFSINDIHLEQNVSPLRNVKPRIDHMGVLGWE